MKNKLLKALFCLMIVLSMSAIFAACSKDPEPTPAPGPIDTPSTQTYTITYEAAEGIKLDEDNPVSAQSGTVVSFNFKLSVFYEGTPVVIVNDNEKKTTFDEDTGVYTCKLRNVTSDQKVDISGATKSESTLASSGSGTQDSPYLIQKPIDLLYMSEIINSGSDGSASFVLGYYSLENSIDLDGEELQIIGDGNNGYAYFGGFLNGNGYSISDFYIDSDSSDNVGLFGVVQANDIGLSGIYGGTIYNLNIENFTITAKSQGTTLLCGALVGQGFGATITLCNVIDGHLEIFGDKNHFAYVGGIIGLQSAYINPYLSSVAYCSSDVDISCNSGTVYAAGGIVGYAVSYSQSMTSTINNCYALGDLTGSFYAGGIAGWLCRYTAVVNCYATGDINAQSTITDVAIMEQYCHAYAGGIVGMMQPDSAVVDCFAVGTLSAGSRLGDKYAHVGEICGKQESTEDGEYDARISSIYNCYYAEGGKNSSIDLTSSEQIKKLLYWHDIDWKFIDGQYPVVNPDESEEGDEYLFTLTFDFGSVLVENDNGASTSLELQISNAYRPMAYWFLVYENYDGTNGIPGMITSQDDKLSYGYYFDKDLQIAVPYGYIPTRDITLYVGFADYSEVAGTYYIDAHSDDEVGYISLTLDKSGKFTCTDASGSHEGVFYYDGESIIFYEARFARYCYEGLINAQQALTYKCVVTENGLEIIGGRYTVYSDDNSSEVIELVSSDNPLIAYNTKKTIAGSYYYSDSSTTDIYTFYASGKGVLNANGEILDFVYSVAGKQLTVEIDGNTVTGQLDDNGKVISIGSNGVKVTDDFAGTWAISSTSKKYYTFDGAGNWEYRYVGIMFIGNGNESYESAIQSDNGTYTVSEDGKSLLLSDGTTVKFDEDGFLSVQKGTSSYTYGKSEGYYGSWSSVDGDVNLELGGISKTGDADAKLSFITVEDGKTLKEIYYLTYEFDLMTEKTLFLFMDGEVYGLLKYSDDGLLKCQLLTDDGEDTVDYTLYRKDDYAGEWISADAAFGIVDFNGYGNYALDISGSGYKGILNINGQEVEYSLDNQSLEGSFRYNGKDYSLLYDDGKNIVTISYSSENYELVKKDVFGTKQYIGTDGKSYSFNGKGTVNQGVLTINDAGTAVTYNYTMADDCVAKLSDNNGSVGSIILTNGGKNYGVVIGNSEAIVIEEVTEFTGEWAMSYAYAALLKIGTMDLDGTMEGKIPVMVSDNVVVLDAVFTLIDEDYLKCTVGVKESGVTVYTDFYVMRLADGKFVVSTEVNWMNSESYSYVMTQDPLSGKWVNAYSWEEYYFDGMGDSTDTYGRAYNKTIGGETLSDYYYRYWERADHSGWDYVITDTYYNSMMKVVFCDEYDDDDDVYVNSETKKAFKLEIINDVEDYIRK